MLSAFADGTLFGERHGNAPLKVLALHGWGRTHRDFDRVLGSSSESALAAIALDLPGFGATPGSENAMTSQDFAHAVSPVLGETSEPIVIVGHSHGGRVAVSVAALHPERVKALVLVGAPLLTRATSKKPSVHYRTMRFLHRMRLVSDQRFEALRRRSGSADYNAAEGVLRDTLVTVINESFEIELSALTCPVVLMWGENDQDVPVEVALRIQTLLEKREMPNAAVRLEVLPGVGHLVPTSAPAALRAAIDSVMS